MTDAHTRLSVNLNKVALLRNARTLGIPSVVRCAEIVIGAGAHGITIHPRPDERHIRTHDVHDLAALLKGYPHVELNIEGNPFENALDLVRTVRPHQFTMVPDDPGAFTSDHGWDLARDADKLRPLIAEVKALGVRVSLFMDAAEALMKAAANIGADRIELYTEGYARAFGTPEQDAELSKYVAAGRAAAAAGLGVNAGHDLNQKNLPAFVGAVPRVLEVSIGHALTAEALEDGLAATIHNYLRALGHAA